MGMRRFASAVASVSAGKTGRTVWSIDHQNLRRWITAVALGCSLCGANRQVEQAVERFVGLDCRDLGGGRLASHRMSHPPLKSRSTGALVPMGDRVGRRCGGRPILGRRLSQEDATNACTEVRRTADGERVDVEWGSWSQAESSAMNVSAPTRISRPSTKTPLETMMKEIGKKCNFSNKSLRHLPPGGRQLSWF